MFIKAGKQLINMDRVETITAANDGKVCVSYTGETCTWLEGADATQFLSGIDAYEIGVTQKTTDEQAADALMRIADSLEKLVVLIGGSVASADVDYAVDNYDSLLANLDGIFNQLGWLKER